MIKRLIEHYKHCRGGDQDKNRKEELVATVTEGSQIKQEMPCISTTSETVSSLNDFPESLSEVAHITGTNNTFTIEQAGNLHELLDNIPKKNKLKKLFLH